MTLFEMFIALTHWPFGPGWEVANGVFFSLVLFLIPLGIWGIIK